MYILTYGRADQKTPCILLQRSWCDGIKTPKYLNLSVKHLKGKREGIFLVKKLREEAFLWNFSTNGRNAAWLDVYKKEVICIQRQFILFLNWQCPKTFLHSMGQIKGGEGRTLSWSKGPPFHPAKCHLCIKRNYEMKHKFKARRIKNMRNPFWKLQLCLNAVSLNNSVKF